MERNENGYPVTERQPEAPKRQRNCDTGTAMCDLDSLMPGYVYAPMQKFCMLYSNGEALKHGTLIEQLYLPMEVYGRERK